MLKQVITFKIEGMKCAGCSNHLEKELNNFNGVIKATVNLATEKSTVEFDAEKITTEDLILKMKFDKTGIGKQNIDNYFKLNYFKVKQNKKLITQYHQYPFKDKILSFCLYLHLPFLAYRIFNKLFKK